MTVKEKSFVLIKILLFVFVALFSVYGYRHYQTQTPPLPGIEDNAKNYIEYLFKKSPSQAYEQFKKDYQDKDDQTAHQVAHFFGDALYEHAGIEGFSVCDGSFGFGCAHTFISLAIAERGVSVSRNLEKVCVETYGIGGLGCTHGIGHGVLAYYGYDFDDLVKALDACDELNWKKPYGGCRDGVFMEYNFLTMKNDSSERARKYTKETAKEPCPSVERVHRVACYFNQVHWLATIFKNDHSKKESLVSFCNTVNEDDERRSCFRSIGYTHATEAQFEPALGSDYCDTLMTSSANILSCYEGFAFAVFGNTQDKEKIAELCSYLSSNNMKAQCLENYLFITQ